MYLLITLISRFYIALTVLILTMITVFSLWPISGSPVIPGSDKTHHLIAYAALMFPAVIRQHKKLWHIAIFFVCFSGAIELIQPYVNRYGEWWDLAANTVGLLCGMLLARLFLFLAGKNKGNRRLFILSGYGSAVQHLTLDEAVIAANNKKKAAGNARRLYSLMDYKEPSMTAHV